MICVFEETWNSGLLNNSRIVKTLGDSQTESETEVSFQLQFLNPRSQWWGNEGIQWTCSAVEFRFILTLLSVGH